MEVQRFDYLLPQELIAQSPAEPRDSSRLLVLHRESGRMEHRIFRDVVEYARAGDVLVLNDTRVRRARLRGRRLPGGGRVEVLLLHPEPGRPAATWRALVRPGRKVLPGQVLELAQGELLARVLARTGEGGRLLQLESPTGRPVEQILQQRGELPLPPYIRRPPSDPERYQTVYARVEGSAAAPTAGLHFTPALLEELKRRGVTLTFVTLHVGAGTFRPVRVQHVEEHRMHPEYYTLPAETARAVEQARARGGRVWAVGTTVVRALESAAAPDGSVRAGSGWTELFIYPGYVFRVVDVLVTNFHLPRSTLLMLVCAFGGTERVLAAYRTAVEMKYRFYSFGDAMLILP